MGFIRKHKKGIIVTVLGIILAAAAAAFGYVYLMFQSVQKDPDVNMPELTNPNLSEEVQESMKGYWTIALFGVDSRDGNLGKGALSDVEMICNINRETGEIRLVSVYRDTYLLIDKKGHYNKINQAYANGGPNQAIAALNENLDLKFDDYATFNWKAVADAINILGGIDLEITKDEFRLINGFITETVESTGIYSNHLTKAGWNHLDGVQAVAYARLRKLDTDFKRTERQRKVIELAMEKAKKAEFSVINNLLVTILPQMSTSIDFNDLFPMAQNLKRYHLGESGGFPFDKRDAMIGSKDCVIPVTLESNVISLHEFLFDNDSYKPSARIKEISSKIAQDYQNRNGGGSKKGTKPAKKETKPEEETLETLETQETTEAQPETSGGIGPGFPPAVLPTQELETDPETGPGVSPGPGITTAPSDEQPKPLPKPEESTSAPEGQEPPPAEESAAVSHIPPETSVPTETQGVKVTGPGAESGPS